MEAMGRGEAEGRWGKVKHWKRAGKEITEAKKREKMQEILKDESEEDTRVRGRICFLGKMDAAR